MKIIVLITLLFSASLSSAQEPTVKIVKDTAILSLKAVTGISPDGLTYSSYAEVNQYPAKDRELFPVMTNVPANLQSQFHYCILVNEYQFYFQNYCAGKLSKDEFRKIANRNKWNLKDTVQLSKKALRCFISIMGGKDSSGGYFYIADRNNNYDYSDDVIYPLVHGSSDQDRIVESSISIELDAFSAGKIVKLEKMIYPVLSGSFKISLMFPQFNFCKLSFNLRNYYLCSTPSGIYLLLDQPNFSPIGSSRKVLKDQVILIDNSQFRLVTLAADGRIVKLVGNDVKAFKMTSSDKGTSLSSGKSPVKLKSNQLGFDAPPITGLNMLNKNLILSTDSLRGKYVYIDFWNTSCGPCIAEFPYLKEAYSKFSREQFEIIGVVEERSSDLAQSIMMAKGVTWPHINIKGKETKVEGYPIEFYPTTYLLDPKGKIIAVNLRGRELVDKLTQLLSRAKI